MSTLERLPTRSRERRWQPSPPPTGGRPTPTRALIAALVLSCGSLMALDAAGAVEPVRSAVGTVLGPAESAATAVTRPVAAIPGWFRSHDSMREEIDSLEAQNASLRRDARTSGLDRNRIAEVRGLTGTAEDLGQALVPSRVIAIGSSQSFSATVTIDAGSRSGIRPDMTVINNDGLVGRVLRTTATTATVLLVTDQDSTVGGRLGDSLKLGFLHGRGELGDQATLDLELVDRTAVPTANDTVVTWGSDGDGPYVPDVPIGTVSKVYTSLRDSSQRIVVDPFVDFSALDLVGVVVPSGSSSDRTIVEADGSLQ